MELVIRPVRLDDAEAITRILNPIIEVGAYTAFDRHRANFSFVVLVSHTNERGTNTVRILRIVFVPPSLCHSGVTDFDGKHPGNLALSIAGQLVGDSCSEKVGWPE